MYIFVYGTLKQGFGNHRFLLEAEFIGAATTDREYFLSDCGFPFASETGSQTLQVVGEVYRVDDPQIANRVDQLEGHPTFYERKQVPVTIKASGVQIPDCWMYLVPEETASRYPACPIIKDHYHWRPHEHIRKPSLADTVSAFS